MPTDGLFPPGEGVTAPPNGLFQLGAGAVLVGAPNGHVQLAAGVAPMVVKVRRPTSEASGVGESSLSGAGRRATSRSIAY